MERTPGPDRWPPSSCPSICNHLSHPSGGPGVVGRRGAEPPCSAQTPASENCKHNTWVLFYATTFWGGVKEPQATGTPCNPKEGCQTLV